MAAYGSPQYPQWQVATEIDHVSAARTHLRAVMPEALLNPSSVEMTLIEALAVMIGPIAMSFQNAPQAVSEHYMGLHSLYRYAGRKARGKALIKLSPSAAKADIPSGTHLRYVVDDYSAALDFYTTEQITIIATDSLEREVHIEAAEIGTAYNGVSKGARLQSINYLLQVQSIVVTETTYDGEDEESDASFEERSRALLSRQTAAITHAEQFEAVALTRPEVGRAFTVNNYDAATGTTATGHVTVAVTNNSGKALLTAEKDAILLDFQRQALASLVIHVVDPSYNTINITLTVEAAVGTNHDLVRQAVIDELTRRLDPMRWDWWTTITGLDMASWVDDVPGVARVITVPPSISLTGVAPLPLPGVIDVTVNPATR